MLVEINSRKLDIIRTTQSTEEFKSIGAINIFKETMLLPVIEIKVINISKI